MQSCRSRSCDSWTNTLILLYFKETRLYDCYQPYRLQFNELLWRVVVGKPWKTRQWRRLISCQWWINELSFEYRFIPEGTGITIPPYTLHRDPRYFSPRSNEFWPERWLLSRNEEKDLILDRAAFIPFSYGPQNCVGKSLAMLELRYITAMLVQQFDMSLEQGFEAETQKGDVRDRFILCAQPLPVIITVRSNTGV